MRAVDQQATELMHSAMPFSKELGIEVLESTTTVVSTRLAWAAQKCTAAGALHGGALMALADATGGMCAFLGRRTIVVETEIRADNDKLVAKVTQTQAVL